MTKVVSVVNNKGKNGLKIEPGLSLFVEFGDKKIMLDLGKSTKNFKFNCTKMGIEVKDVDILVISHYHFDHSGALKMFLERNEKAKVYLMKFDDSNVPFVKILGGVLKKNIDIPWRKLIKDEKYKDRFVFVEKNEKGFTEIEKNVFLITEFKKKFPLSTCQWPIHIKNIKTNEFMLDTFEHELALAIRDDEKKKVLLFSPCSHNGILNILHSTIEKECITNSYPISFYAGLHFATAFVKEPIENITKSAKEIEKLFNEKKLSKSYVMHCTTYKGFQKISETINNDDVCIIDYMFCGDTHQI